MLWGRLPCGGVWGLSLVGWVGEVGSLSVVSSIGSTTFIRRGMPPCLTFDLFFQQNSVLINFTHREIFHMQRFAPTIMGVGLFRSMD